MTRKSITGILSFGALVPIVAQLAIAASGCSSADDNTSNGGAAGAPSGGNATGGGGVSPTGGMPSGGMPTGGSTTGGSATGGSGGGSTAGECKAIASPADCRGIRNAMMCTMAGQSCADLPCGVSDVGRRSCDCVEGLWNCTPCDFPRDYAACPIMEPPATPLAECDATVQATLPCTSSRGERCMQGAEVCICWPDDEGALAWDCDTPPAFWSMP